MHTLAKWIGKLALAMALASPSVGAAEHEADFADAELDRLLAPIALYPDTVLSHVLIAATYPLEVVEAARWSRRHPDLRGEEAVAAAEPEDWDASVKALVAFPELLARMDADLDWTRDLGDAFLAQEHAVADRVQHLRRRAYDSGHLDALEHVRVIHEPEVIYIEPAVTRVIYVPFYDTRVVYGSWWWPAYPPVYWAFPHHHHGAVWYWGHGFRVAPSFYFSAWHWPQRRVVVTRHVHHHHFQSARDVTRHRDARPWRHDSSHRRNVSYRHERVRQAHAPRSSIRHERRESDRNSRSADRRRRDELRHGIRREEAGDNRKHHSSRGDPPDARTERGVRGRQSSGEAAESPRRTERPAQRQAFRSSAEAHDEPRRNHAPARGQPETPDSRSQPSAREHRRDEQRASPGQARLHRGGQEQRSRQRREP